MQKKVYSIEEIKRKLENYCSYQDRCHQEIEKKIKEYNLIEASREVILLHLMEHDFLNEERFAKSFSRGKFNTKKWGKNRITRELKFRDISNYNIKIALKEINDEDYKNEFNRLAIKRLKDISKETNIYKKRKKLADYLLYRGWETELVYEKVKELVP